MVAAITEEPGVLLHEGIKGRVAVGTGALPVVALFRSHRLLVDRADFRADIDREIGVVILGYLKFCGFAVCIRESDFHSLAPLVFAFENHKSRLNPKSK
jgi:hypothetical protein